MRPQTPCTPCPSWRGDEAAGALHELPARLPVVCLAQQRVDSWLEAHRREEVALARERRAAEGGGVGSLDPVVVSSGLVSGHIAQSSKVDIRREVD